MTKEQLHEELIAGGYFAEQEGSYRFFTKHEGGKKTEFRFDYYSLRIRETQDHRSNTKCYYWKDVEKFKSFEDLLSVTRTFLKNTEQTFK